MTPTTTRVTTVALIVLSLLVPAVVRAQELSPADKAMAKEHFDKGRAAYDGGQFEDAIKELKQAYMISRKAAILFNLGQTYRKLGDGALSLHFFQKFVTEADPEDPNRPSAQTAIEELQNEAAKKDKAAEPATPPVATPVPSGPDKSDGDASDKSATPELGGKAPDFRHLPVGEAPPGKPVDVKIRVGDEAASFPSFLFYRIAGQESYAKVPFTAGPAGLSARIPKKVMSSGNTSVQYYVETRSLDGKIYGSSASAANPNVIVVDPKAPARTLTAADGSEVGSDDDEDEEEEGPWWTKYYRTASYSSAGAAILMLGVGTVYLAKGTRLSADFEGRARSSSRRDPATGMWGSPQLGYGSDLNAIQDQGKTANTIAGVTLVLGAVFGAAAGALFYLDRHRESSSGSSDGVEVSFAPLCGPGFGGAGGILRF